jgi:hypothetical protein
MTSEEKLKFRQLSNDLNAALIRCRAVTESNENLRRDHALQSTALIAAYRERDDWREAFKTVSKLVK